ncbi:hypothetical protein ACFO1B_28925 [Dactylosporangium siamense]|uniref:hypothetical protein n=1 Tax=Dactylosporangium siamense TaxID=685454 RepID=UPI00194342CA|nr:hypothetical protein [Dactylosporangium siamense]
MGDEAVDDGGQGARLAQGLGQQKAQRRHRQERAAQRPVQTPDRDTHRHRASRRR